MPGLINGNVQLKFVHQRFELEAHFLGKRLVKIYEQISKADQIITKESGVEGTCKGSGDSPNLDRVTIIIECRLRVEFRSDADNKAISIVAYANLVVHRCIY